MPVNDPLYQDQLDTFARLQADDFFSDVAVLLQRKGVTDSDIEVALSTLNTKSGKMGALAVVLMPELTPDSSESAGARYKITLAVQVIEQPLFNEGSDGTGKSAERLAERVRQLLQQSSFGRGSTWSFAGMEPISQGDGKISYGVKFARLGGDPFGDRLPTPAITATGSGPISITLVCADTVASLWYTLDGSYPWPGNPTAALFQPHTAVEVAIACTLRAAVYRSGYQPSNIASAIISAPAPQAPG